VEHAREVVSLGETVSSLKTQLERLTDEHQKALEKSEEDAQSLLELKDELAARAAGAGELAQLDAKRDLEAATGDVERMRAELARVNGELESARTGSKERDLVKRLAEMEERLANGAQEAQRLEGELAEVRSLKAQLESQLASATSAQERERQLEELQRKEEERKVLFGRVEGLARELEEVTKKLDSTTSELEDARQATKSGDGEEVALRQALEDVKEELDMTKSVSPLSLLVSCGHSLLGHSPSSVTPSSVTPSSVTPSSVTSFPPPMEGSADAGQVLEMNKSHFAEQLDHSAKQYSSAIDRLNEQSTSLLEGKQAAEAVIAQMTDEVKRLQRDLEVGPALRSRVRS
jgi:chromosome segregation ATPase